MDKAVLLEQIVASLVADLEGYMRSARSAQAEATNEQSKAENKYDTRGLEASYLAHGQSRQAAETAQTIEHYRALVVPTFPAGSPIALGALVELEQAGERQFYFMGPSAGGTEVEVKGTPVLVITPQSPLGQELMGKSKGTLVTLGARGQVYQILSVQ